MKSLLSVMERKRRRDRDADKSPSVGYRLMESYSDMEKLYRCLLILLALFSSIHKVTNGLEVNLATGGTATQSSTYDDRSADGAIDGSVDTTCTETIIGSNPWWRLDLRDVYYVNRVVITNRFICCSDEINGAEIHIGNSLENDGNNNPICAFVSYIPAGESYNFSCSGMEGQYVNLFIAGEKKILTMCEVEVYGKGHAVARTMVKMQFSSSSDLTDPSVRNQLLKHLGTALDDRGLKNVTVQWSQPPKKEVMEVKHVKRCSDGHE